MLPVNRALLLVKPALPYINWMRTVAGVETSSESLQRGGGAYLVGFDAFKEPTDAVIAQYWEGIFEFELAKRAPDTELWPEKRDLATFRRWFDVELRDLVVDLGSEPLYVDPDEFDESEEWEDDEFEEFAEALADNPLLNRMIDALEVPDDVDVYHPWGSAPFDELFPPPPFVDTDDLLDESNLPDKGPTRGLVYQFNITLQGVEPPVWRRIQIPAGYSFWDLHVAITDAMGWLDYHLHLFSVLNPETGEREPIGIFDEANPDGPDRLPDAIVPIASYFRKPGDGAWYTYDFGDMWVHKLVLEAVLPREKGKRYPTCLDGARVCPPEDVGGPHGYAMMLEILDDPSHPEHESYVEWLGGRFDPDRFDPKKVTFDSPKKRLEIALGGDEPF